MITEPEHNTSESRKTTMSDQDGDTSDSVEYEFAIDNDPNTVYQVKKSKITNGEITQMVLDDDSDPHIEIVEQPQPRGFRFRYECEGPSHGGLQGEKSEKYRKTYPAIKIKNYNGPARVVVTLVTDEVIPRPHAHKLVGRNCNEGTCIVELKGGQNSLTFPNLCVQHVTRRKASEVIEQRILESIKLDKLVKLGDLNAQAELTMEDLKQAKTQAEKLAKEMQLNVVKLCFQAYLRDETGMFSRLLPSILSNPIYDSKSPGANALKICRMDKYGGCCTGNEEVFLLCEKVQKDDISVRFVEQDEDGNVTWEAYGSFGPFDVHRQYAIVFKTPPYKDPAIDRAVNVLIMLQRKSDSESSDPKSFTYYPQNIDMDDIRKKRKKTLPIYPGSGNFGSGGGGSKQPGGGGNFFGTVNGNSMSESQGNMPTTVNQDDDAPAPSHRNITKAVRRHAVKQHNTHQDLETDTPPAVKLPCQSLNQTVDPFFTNQQLSQPTIPQSMPIGIPQTTAYSTPVNTNLTPSQTLYMPNIATVPQTSAQNTYTATSHNNQMGLSRNHHISMPPYLQQIPELQTMYDNTQYQGQILLAPTNMYMNPNLMTRGTEKEISPISSIPLTVNEDRDILEKYSDQIPLTVSGEFGTCPPQIPLTVSGHDMVDGPVKMESKVVHQPIQHVRKIHSDPGSHAVKNDVSVQTESDHALKMAERTAKAIQLYAATGDIRQLLTVQRYLTCIADEDGDIPLHTCIINHQLEVVHNLLDVMATLPNAQSKINVHNRRLQTPLHLAVITGQEGVVDALLKTGAEPTVLDRHGNTAAHLASLYKKDKCLAAMLKYIRPRVSRQRPFPELDIKNIDGLTPIHISAQKEDLTSIKLLVKGKADVNMADGKSGRTALHYAAGNDDLSTAGWLLLEAKAAVNATCFDGNTALHVACGRQNIGMVALLMAAGADPKVENMDYEDEGSENENEDEKDKDEMIMKEKSQRGRTAEDFAMDNDKILKVLYGHPYTSMSEIHEEADNREYEQTAEMFTSLSLVKGEREETGLSSIGPITEGGDMASVLYPQRVKLSQLLDPARDGQDWRALADRLGFRKLISGSQKGHSPTRILFNYYEECGGTVKRLKDALMAIHRTDAVKLLSHPDSVVTGMCGQDRCCQTFSSP
ncbi:nuclear factor NF-kappa-B p105 subunit-like isoform X2 [Ylistrum balloti]|uniref:nuclear factor NF-kappa-B p105 subunit-like isoform X2 n=1 Tax=Ylistrum balloti TaxID=509963 RepID=UPI002905EC09|nr:nuclear factor NF-kappa-B p105 subunit-like isoform X2 [Ylistrum balloti]